MAELAVSQQLEHLLDRQLISLVGERAYAFRHALLREAVYATLLRRERREMHGAVAQTLEALYADALDEHLADLAYHYFENEMWDKAQAFAQRAGEQAQRREAAHEAHTHYTHAITAAQHRGQMPPTELYRARGQVREVLGDFDGSRDDHETALAAARAADQPRAEWQTLLDLGYLWAGRDYAQAGRYFQQALALARSMDNPLVLGRSLNRLGNWHFNREEIVDALRCHREALALFERHPDPRGVAETHDLLGLTFGYHGDIHTARTHSERCLALFRELGDRQGQASSLTSMAELGPTFGSELAETAITLREAHFLVDQSLKLSRAIGWRAGEAYALLSLGSVRLSAGDFGQALHDGRQGERVATEIGHLQWQTLAQVFRSRLYFELGQYPAAAAAAAEACAGAERVHSVIWMRFGHLQTALICMAQGDLPGAEAALAGQLDPDRLPDTAAQRMLAFAYGRLALLHGRPDQTIAIVERLRASIPNPSPGFVIPRLWKLHAEALAALGQWPEAEALLLAALPLAHEIRILVWQVHAGLAGVYAAQGRSAEAEQEAATARQVVTELAATIPEADQRETFTTMALARVAQPWPGGPPQ